MRFQLRSFISFTMFLAFLVLASSGVALYLRPEGSLARWTGWTLLGMSKKGWEGAHTLFAVTFVIISVVHLSLNWKTIINYLYDKLTRGLRRRNELLAALGLIGMILLLAVFQLRPAWIIMDLRDDIKNGSNLSGPALPEPDFEKRSLIQIAEKMNVDVRRVIEKMRAHGLSVYDERESLLSIANSNNLTPQDIYRYIIALSVE